MGDISIKGSSPILHGKRNVNGKQKHPIKDFPEEAAALLQGIKKVGKDQKRFGKRGK